MWSTMTFRMEGFDQIQNPCPYLHLVKTDFFFIGRVWG